jgi:hypothetical protein
MSNTPFAGFWHRSGERTPGRARSLTYHSRTRDMNDNEPRRYTEAEFARILQRALELQREGEPRRLLTEGLTLAEMQAAAGDVGIDPALIARAADLLPDGDATRARILGGPTRYRLSGSTAAVAGPDDLARVVDRIRGELHTAGRVRSELGGLTWESEGEPSQIHVTLRPGDDRTEVRVSVNRDAAFILTYFLSLTAGLVSAGVTGAVLDPPTAAGGALLLGSGAAGGLAVARVLWARSTRVIRERVEHLLDSVTSALRR